jgi:hypothetical protein
MDEKIRSFFSRLELSSTWNRGLGSVQLKTFGKRHDIVAFGRNLAVR